MRFDLVWITREKNANGGDEYRSFVQFDGRTATRFFADKDEMANTLRKILASQETKQPEPNEALKRIEAGSLQFSGANALDLTAEQAKLLGWI